MKDLSIFEHKTWILHKNYSCRSSANTWNRELSLNSSAFDDVVFFCIFLFYKTLKRLHLALCRGPGGFRGLREACWNTIHLSCYLSDSYGIKLWPKKPSGFVCFVYGICICNILTSNLHLTTDLRVLVGLKAAGKT